MCSSLILPDALRLSSLRVQLILPDALRLSSLRVQLILPDALAYPAYGFG